MEALVVAWERRRRLARPSWSWSRAMRRMTRVNSGGSEESEATGVGTGTGLAIARRRGSVCGELAEGCKSVRD